MNKTSLFYANQRDLHNSPSRLTKLKHNIQPRTLAGSLHAENSCHNADLTRLRAISRLTRSPYGSSSLCWNYMTAFSIVDRQGLTVAILCLCFCCLKPGDLNTIWHYSGTSWNKKEIGTDLTNQHFRHASVLLWPNRTTRTINSMVIPTFNPTFTPANLEN